MAEREVSVRLTAFVETYVAAMRRASGATDKFATDAERATAKANAGFKKLGGDMQAAGGMLSRNVTLPLVAAGGAAVKMSFDFERAFAQMEGLAGVTADEVDGLKASVLELSGRTATAPQELAEALYFAKSAGLDTAGAMKAVEVAAKASAAGMGSASDVVGLAASAVASYGEANITAAEATDILTSTIREGRADPDELAGSLGRILPIAASMGVTFDQVGGTVAYLSNIFGDTDRTVTAVNDAFAKLAAPTDQSREALKNAGTSAEELQATIRGPGGLLAGLELLREHGFAGNQAAIRELMPDMQGAAALTALLADESGSLASTLDAVAASSGSLDSAFSAVADTSGFKMKQAWVDLQAALIQAGDIIVPIVADIAGGFAGLIRTFTSLPEPVQKILLAFLAVAAAAGPLLTVGGKLVSNFSRLSDMAGKLATKNAALATVLGVAAIAMIAYSTNASNDADALRDATEAALDFSRVNDDMIGANLERWLQDVALAGRSAESSFADLAKTNLEGAKRLLESGEAAKRGGDIVKLLTAAIKDEEEARRQAAAVTAEQTTVVNTATDALTAASAALDELATSTSKGTALTERYARQRGEAAHWEEVWQRELDATADALEEATRVADEHREHVKQLADGYSTITDAVQAYMDTETALYDAQRSRISDELAYEVALDNTEAAVGRLNEAMTDEKANLEDIDDAARDAAAAAITQSEAYATLEGASLNTAVGVQRQIDSLYRQAGALSEDSPLRARLLGYIAELQAIPAIVDTTLRLKITGANVTIGGDLINALPGSGGKKAGGGPVRAGRSYEVLEGGRSELLTERGRTYLMAGSDGYVTPLTPAGISTSTSSSTYDQRITYNARTGATVDELSRAVVLARLSR